MTYPTSSLPKPLGHTDFYILLALCRQELHAYAIGGVIQNVSLGSTHPEDGSLHRQLQKLHDLGFIEKTRVAPAGKSGKPRMHYGISGYGLIRLQEEIQRMEHAAKVARNAGIMKEDVPADIQRLLVDLLDRREG